MQNETDKKTNVRTTDLTDSKQDQEKLKGETTTIDMPEVKDIPGQENVRVPKLGEMADVTASSEDEEADELLSELDADDDDVELDDEADVTEEEKKLLRRGAGHPRNEENEDIAKMSLDSTDDDGEALNEGNLGEDRFGEDHDVPGAELDDEDEDVGEEDEENNQYSV